MIKQLIKRYWLLGLILATAAFFRLYTLGSLPYGLHPDEAANGLDIIRMIEQGHFSVFYNTNGPREALFFYLQAGGVLLGLMGAKALYFTPLALRLAPAVLGIITVWGLYLLANQLMPKRYAYFTSFLLAVSSWHVHFSRNGFRAMMVPLILVFLFYFLVRLWRKPSRRNAIMAGSLFGLGFHTYIAYQITPVLILGLISYIVIFQSQMRKRALDILRSYLWLFGASALAVTTPLIIYFAAHPQDLFGRASGTSILNSKSPGESPALVLAQNIHKTAFMFNVQGDQNVRHNEAPDLPQLDYVTGFLFILGLAAALLSLNRPIAVFLVAWFLALLLPNVLSAEGIPHALRSVGVIPVIYLIGGFGLWRVGQSHALKSYGRPIVVGLVALALAVAGTGFYRYFIIFDHSTPALEAYAEDMYEISRDLTAGTEPIYGLAFKTSPDLRENVLFVGNYDTKTIEFAAHRRASFTQVELRDAGNFTPLRQKPSTKFYFQNTWTDQALPLIAHRYPDGKLRQHRSQYDNRVIFTTYEITDSL